MAGKRKTGFDDLKPKGTEMQETGVLDNLPDTLHPVDQQGKPEVKLTFGDHWNIVKAFMLNRATNLIEGKGLFPELSSLRWIIWGAVGLIALLIILVIVT
jgi:hypothetical protein